MSGKEYLGDAVYVEIENGMFKLTTEDGISVTNTIYMEPEVYRAFFEYAKRAEERARRANRNEIEQGEQYPLSRGD